VRGPDEQTHEMFSYLSPEARVRQDHPLRAIRQMTHNVFKRLSPRFARLYSDIVRFAASDSSWRRSTTASFRWFIGLGLDEPIWSPTSFSKNRDRLLAGDVAAAFFDAVRAQAEAAGLMSDEHFTVDTRATPDTTSANGSAS
jgi:hypothetical protein